MRQEVGLRNLTIPEFAVPPADAPRFARLEGCITDAMAEARAKELLFSYLTEEQKQSLVAKHHFDIQAKNGFQYRVWCNRSTYNVSRINPKALFGLVLQLCTLPRSYTQFVSPDIILTQKLLIETDPERFEGTANKREVSAADRHDSYW